ncbi:DMT family transporter [Gemella sp. zg-570]|uniref:DMT family transporter n=1 Tax=Gemella sp. zg-570 TaxID=2840371 RepID=UPI001C0DCA23|nr:DMT family transporter [Gemella sp. zg-570]QWQ38474.1 DMT family transporter [Gemella sp. zg-570]
MNYSKIDYIKYIISLLIFGSIGILVKNINMPSSHIVLFRTIIASIFFILLFTFTKNKINLQDIQRNLFLLVLSGFALGINWVFLFEAYSYTSISIATLLYYFTPTLVIAISPLIFRDSFPLVKAICILLSTLGMTLVANINIFEISANAGIVYGLASAVGYTLLVIINKKISKIDGHNSTFVQMIVASLVLAIYVIFINGDSIQLPKNNFEISYLLILGVVHTGLACLLYFSAIAKLPTTNIAFLSYVDPISALFFAYIFLGESLNFYQIIGATLILGSSLFAQIKIK